MASKQEPDKFREVVRRLLATPPTPHKPIGKSGAKASAKPRRKKVAS